MVVNSQINVKASHEVQTDIVRQYRQYRTCNIALKSTNTEEWLTQRIDHETSVYHT